MVDNDKHDIGSTEIDENPLGEPINALDPYFFTSKLPYPLVIVGEHENDCVQFTYNSLRWTSKTNWTSSASNGLPKCSLGGWAPVDGPVCDGTSADNVAVCFCHATLKSTLVSYYSCLMLPKTNLLAGESNGLLLPVLEIDLPVKGCSSRT